MSAFMSRGNQWDWRTSHGWMIRAILYTADQA